MPTVAIGAQVTSTGLEESSRGSAIAQGCGPQVESLRFQLVAIDVDIADTASSARRRKVHIKRSQVVGSSEVGRSVLVVN